MEIRVTRPGFIQGIQALAESDAPTPHLPSIEQWREGSRKEPYEPNKEASRSEMRSFVCWTMPRRILLRQQHEINFSLGQRTQGGRGRKILG